MHKDVRQARKNLPGKSAAEIIDNSRSQNFAVLMKNRYFEL